MTIIQIDFIGNQKPYFAAQPPQGRATYCNHRTVEVDKHTRSVACTGCGSIIDAFDYLHGLATKEIGLFESLDRLRKEETELTKKVAALRNEERNVKARLKTAHKKQAMPKPQNPVPEKKDKQNCIAEIKEKLRP